MGFYGRPDTWGILIQAIRIGPASSTCMTTFGHWIAVACSDGVVKIYHAVTGALRLSLGPMDTVRAMGGSPDGSTLICTHQETSITSWDIQTGGLIRDFTLTEGVQHIDVSFEGRYLACGFSSGSIKVLGIANGVRDVAVQDSPPNTPFCWLEPEEKLVVAEELSMHRWDIAVGRIVHSFTIAGRERRPGCEGEGVEKERIFGVVYLQGLDQLAAIIESPSGSTLTIVHFETGTVLASLEVREIAYSTFSRATKELVCRMRAGELRVFRVLEKGLSWRLLELSHTVKVVSSLPNGTVAVDAGNFGVQLLSLDQAYAPASQSRTSVLPAISTFDQDKIVAFCLSTNSPIQLLKRSTMSHLVTISTQGLSTNKPLTAVLCASLDHRVAVYHSQSGPKAGLKLQNFGAKDHRWTVEADGQPSACGISPDGTRLVTFHNMERETRIYAWDTRNGKPQAELSVDNFTPLPPSITFDSETRFYSHHGNYRIPYDLDSSPGSHPTHTIIPHEQQPWTSTVEPSKMQHDVDSSHEWVVSGHQQNRSLLWCCDGR